MGSNKENQISLSIDNLTLSDIANSGGSGGGGSLSNSTGSINHNSNNSNSIHSLSSSTPSTNSHHHHQNGLLSSSSSSFTSPHHLSNSTGSVHSLNSSSSSSSSTIGGGGHHHHMTSSHGSSHHHSSGHHHSSSGGSSRSRTSRSSTSSNTSNSNGGGGGEDNNYYSMAKMYLNNRVTTTNTHGLGRVDFNMKSEDLDQLWFHKEATRDVSMTLLNNKPIGTFLIRPSSQAGSYAMSWVKNNGEVGHNLIYGLCPGYSLKQNPTGPTDRFWSLQKLVEGCDYLVSPIEFSSTTASIAKTSNSRTNSEVIGRIVERVSANDSTLSELIWSLCIIGENSANDNFNRCEKRTNVRYSDEEYTAPEILPLNGNALSLITQSLYNNTYTHSVFINGYEGYLRMSFFPNLNDNDSSAIAELIRRNKSITLLNLSVNQISDSGVKLIAEALKVNTTLKYLSLSYNFIGKEGLVSLSESLRVNRTLDFVDVSNQLYKKRNLINLTHSDTERTLISLIEESLKRKCELLGMSSNILELSGPSLSPHLNGGNNNSNSNSSNSNSQSNINFSISFKKLPYFHGFLTKQAAEKRINLVGKGKPGSFLFYLNHYIPNSIFLAILVPKPGSNNNNNNNNNNNCELEIVHKMIHRVHFGYKFVNGGLSTLEQDLRDESMEEELLYNFQINNSTHQNTITHSNSYNYSYRYRPKRKGCGVVIPTLFEFCSWILASHPQYQEIYDDLVNMGGISERFRDIHDLVPLWGARDVHPIINVPSTKHNISRKGVYPTLSQLYKLNRSKLTNPITTDQYKVYKEQLESFQLQQHLLQQKQHLQQFNNY